MSEADQRGSSGYMDQLLCLPEAESLSILYMQDHVPPRGTAHSTLVVADIYPDRSS